MVVNNLHFRKLPWNLKHAPLGKRTYTKTDSFVDFQNVKYPGLINNIIKHNHDQQRIVVELAPLYQGCRFVPESSRETLETTI